MQITEAHVARMMAQGSTREESIAAIKSLRSSTAEERLTDPEARGR